MSSPARGAAASPCLGDDTVLEFVEGVLASGDEEALHQHLGDCPDCRRLVAETAKLHHDTLVEPSEPTGPAPAHAAERLPEGQEVGRYVLMEPRGAGGMGVVYEAYDPRLHRTIALKLLRAAEPELGDQPTRQARFLREAQVMARLSHPNVVAVHDTGEYEGQVYIAMELVPGEALSLWLGRRPRSLDEILGVYAQAGHGLAAAHSAGLVHRDFKPQNVLVGENGQVKVTDFGIARSTSPHRPPTHVGAPVSVPDGALTRTGSVVGTPAYMSPEQLQGLPTDAASDQFSFCVALYESVYGERPFEGGGVAELARSVLRGQVREPLPGTAVPQALREILLRGLQVDRQARYPSMQALLEALGGAQRSPVTRSRRALWLALAVTATLVAVGAVAAIAGYDPFVHEEPSVSQSPVTSVAPPTLPAPSPAPSVPITSPIEIRAGADTPPRDERGPTRRKRGRTMPHRPNRDDDALMPFEEAP